jgi:hypothetical protein
MVKMVLDYFFKIMEMLIRAKGFGFSEIRHLGFFNFSEIRLINMGLGVLRCITTV